jgi:hypothetical protein
MFFFLEKFVDHVYSFTRTSSMGHELSLRKKGSFEGISGLVEIITIWSGETPTLTQSCQIPINIIYIYIFYKAKPH